ncbi:hypothetical protein SLE2022_160800 [Rubroshorea leprosula]
MAQAARLNLRMQKELKLLLTDPPPGASFPFLSPDSDLPSLSSIDAQIEGAEGTVYAKGIFKIKIQIPDRYPFQPPIVTFATPIYHPNIDTGGRICLDILNLPPKGAWQPSLNISTVLTSIGLLLSEPNPDDGLMCEASREYKYNRQAFDHKARAMTEKYAKAGDGGSSSSQCIQTMPNPSMVEVQGVDKGSKQDTTGSASSDGKQSGISHKLSFKSLSSSKGKEGDSKENEMPGHHISSSELENQMEIKGKRKEENSALNECNLNCVRPHGIRRKLSLDTSGQFKKNEDDNKENVDPNCCQSLYHSQNNFIPPFGTSELQVSNNHEQLLQHQDDKSTRYTRSTGSKPCQISHKKPLRSFDSCQISDGSKKKLLETTKPFSSKSYSLTADDVSPIPLPVKHGEVQPSEDFSDRTGNIPAHTKIEKHTLLGKKLSLGFKGSSQKQDNNKENVVPVNQLPLSKPQSPFRKSGLGCKLSLRSLSQLQGSKEDHRQSENFSTNASESLPVPQDSRYDWEQQPNQDESMKTEREIIKEHGAEETEGPPLSETIIVLDSEDSEEEGQVSSRQRLSLARKRIGKTRAKA